jgi:phage tail-like protein
VAILSQHPYSQFNFLLDLGSGAAGPHAGFQECSAIQKLAGLNKSAEVTLKRGVINSAQLQQWLDQIRKNDKARHRTVKVMQQDEEHNIVQTWKLLRGRIIKHISGPRNAKGGDVAIEELVIAYERQDLD